MLLVAGLAACTSGARTTTPGRPQSPAAKLDQLADEFWLLHLRADPSQATLLGVPGYDHLLPDLSPAALASGQAQLERLDARAAAIDTRSLTPARRATLAVLRNELDSRRAIATCQMPLWVVDHLAGPQVWLLDLGSVTRADQPAQVAAYRERLGAVGAYMDAHISNLRRGLAQGLVAPAMNVRRTLAQLDEIAAVPVASDPLLAADAGPETIAVVRDVVRPAFARYRQFLADELLAVAREQVGVGALPIGERCYAASARAYTTLELSATELHALGLREVARIRLEMAELSQRLFPGEPLGDVLARLRIDPRYAFASREEVEAAAVDAVARVEAVLPVAFSELPAGKVAVRRLEPHAERDAPMAYYQLPAEGGARQGSYLVNTYMPQTRPRYTAQVLACHEAVPGHHLQLALAQELTALPAFQRHARVTVFVEGWALYAERLCDELGVYRSDLDRLGMLSFDAWRAARLVVDSAIHGRGDGLGWTRQQAIDYMLANTASALPDIENEVDRYITWPGQALAYKVGQLEISRVRAEAERRLGVRFDLREFHRRVLRNGAVPLSVLDDEINDWIRSEMAETSVR